METLAPADRCLTRRRWLGLAGLALAGTGGVQSGPWPTKPITMVIGFPPGGSTDFIARVIGDKLSEALGQPVVYENKGGANGLLASNAVAAAAPDGYTLLLASMGLTTNPHLYTRATRHPVRDFTPISLLVSVPNVVVAGPSVQAGSLAELIRLAKSRKAPLTLATTGQAAPGHLASELIQRAAGVRFQFVAYKGSGPALTDVMAGHVDLSLPTVVAAMPGIRGNRLKAIAVTGDRRSGLLPDVPSVAEAGLKELTTGSGWYGLVAPAGLPRAVLARLDAEVSRIIKMPDVRDRLAANGADPIGLTSAEMATFVADDFKRWGDLIREANIKPENE